MDVYVAPCDLGRGLFAARDFAVGKLNVGLTMQEVTLAEILRNKDTGDPLQIDDDMYLDLEAPGVFPNHSCEPNAGVKSDRNLTAIKPIQRDEEIRWDYSTSRWEGIWTMECSCGSASCRKIIQEFYQLSEAVQ